MSDLTETDFPPLEPQPFVTEEGREIERLRAELSKKFGELAAAIKQRDEARREAMQWWRERFSTKEFKEEVGQRGWEYLLVEGGGA